MRLLVLGADGFIGSRLVKILSGRYELFPVGDYLDGELLDLTVYDNAAMVLDRYRPEGIINLAGKSYHSARDEADIYESNLLIQVNLNEAVREMDLDPRIVFCSSSSVYKSSLDVVGEGAHCRPANAYARAKYLQERVGLSYHPRQRVIVARLFNVIGPGQSKEYFIPAVIERMVKYKKGQSESVWLKTLHATRDFVFIDDVCEALSLLVEKGSGGEIYNVCGGRGVPLREVLDILKEILEMEKLALEVQDDHVREGIDYQAGENRKLASLGWSPAYDIRRALETIVGEEYGN
ncbi:MAG: NAD(P)-dependent oxidoreductase [Candidatus Krumholzibacteriota bacterium]|nr:NAD(P)-dependent oxidoreductase [Candidatus Krumholzibacteriota bacterium]